LSQRRVAIANLHPRLRVDRGALLRAVRALDGPAPPLARPGSALSGAGDLSIVFLTDPALAGLHARFLGDPSATDVITFDHSRDHQPGVAGEICVSADAAVRQARAGSGRTRRFSSELALYIVHGWLHLAGHDDLTPTEKRRMRRAEARAMRHLRENGLLPVFELSRRPP
jgi:probable rRNA maturation factor